MGKNQVPKASAPVSVHFLLLATLTHFSWWCDQGGLVEMLSPHLLSLGRTHLAAGLAAFACHLMIQGSRGFFVSNRIVTNTEVTSTLGLVSLIFSVLFVAVLSRLSLARKNPAKITVCNPNT